MSKTTDRHGTPLWAKPLLTIPQVMRLMGIGREKVKSRIESGDWEIVQDGKRPKISTQSIKDWIDRETRNQRRRVGLDTE